MFSLIITIIAIALVAALALAAIYYGGSAFNKGSASAKATRLVAQGQQIAGAWQFFQVNKAAETASGNVVDINDLVSQKYLVAVPEAYEHGFIDKGVLRDGELITLEICNELEKRAGRAGYQDNGDIPSATIDGPALPGKFGCYKGTSYGAYYKL